MRIIQSLAIITMMYRSLVIIFIVVACSGNPKKVEMSQTEWEQMGESYFFFLHNDKLDSALFIAKQRLDFALISLNKKRLSNSYNDLGIVYMYLGQFDTATKQFEEALKVSPKSGQIYYNLALLQQRQGKDAEAFNSINHSLELYGLDSLTSEKSINQAKIALAGTLMTQSNFSEAVKIIKEALEWGISANDTAFVIEGSKSIAKEAVYVENFELADSIYRHLIGYYSEHSLPLQVANTYNDIGSVFYFDENYDSAIFYFKKSIHLKLKTQTDSSILYTSYKNLARTYNEMGQFIKEKETREIMEKLNPSKNR